MPRIRRQLRAALTTSMAAAMLASLLLAGVVPTVSAATGGAKAIYIVQLADLPVAAYDGSIKGYAATRAAPGNKLNAHSRAAKAYDALLVKRHDAALAKVKGAKKLYDYTTGFNGFAATMTADAANALRRSPGILSVSKNEIRSADTVSTPTFLGLDAKHGVWSQAGGPKNAGKNLVIGVIDSGIWPENPSFAPIPGAAPLTTFSGTCETGEEWDASLCTNKIVGARFYDEGLGGPDGVHALNATEYLSPRDHHGHGSHTSSTAAGNYHTDAVVNGSSLGFASGMAPAARIAVYKALWGPTSSGTASGSSADLVAAIDDAVADGVDVINFSVSGSLTSDVDPVEIAFLFAADAGVFVSTSAGNDGPGASTVAHDSPWLMTTAAGTHDRSFLAAVTLGNGATYTGAGLGAAVPSSPLVLSTAAALTGASATSAALCFSKDWDPAHPEGALDPAKVAGRIVVCDRGTNDRVDKSQAVQEAGGIGMVLANVTPNSLNADFHSVPTVHLQNTDGDAVKAYVAATANPTASLSQGHVVSDAEAPLVASFSSRGPGLAADGDILKPDLMAPGVDVLAAVSPDNHAGRMFDFDSGTSMAAPHVAGIAALLHQIHPDWSPLAIKSALMTTASRIDNAGSPLLTDTGAPADAFDYGSGQVVANPASDPGLVYDSGFAEWVQFLCGSAQLDPAGGTCAAFGSIDPSDLNTPNIAIGDLVASQTVTRTVTGVGTTDKYTVHVDAPAGFQVSVSPTTIKVKKGETVSYQVTFTRTTAAANEFSLGSLEWRSNKHVVHSQLAIRPLDISAPAEATGTGTSGSVELAIRPGYTGTLTASPAGLVPATVATATLSNATGGSFSTTNPAAGPHTLKTTVTVPAGSILARFATFDADVPAGTDLDVFVYAAGTTTLVGASSGATAEEQVDLATPAAGSYDVYVDLFATAPGVTSQAVSAFSWALGTSAAGDLSATPATQPVTIGVPTTVTAAWTGLTAGTRYLGSIELGNGTETIGRTLIRIDG